MIYDIHGKLARNFLLLDVVTTAHVLECHFWGNGVVAITSDMQIFVAEAGNYYFLGVFISYLNVLFLSQGLSSLDTASGIRKYKLRTSLGADRPYTAMAIVPPLLSRSGLLEV